MIVTDRESVVSPTTFRATVAFHINQTCLRCRSFVRVGGVQTQWKIRDSLRDTFTGIQPPAGCILDGKIMCEYADCEGITPQRMIVNQENATGW